MQYRLSPMQNQPGFQNMINQGNAMRGINPDLAQNLGPRNYGVPPGNYVGSPYHAVPGLQHPMAYPGGMMNHRPLSSSPISVPSGVTVSNNSVTSPGTSKGLGGQIEGGFYKLC